MRKFERCFTVLSTVLLVSIYAFFSVIRTEKLENIYQHHSSDVYDSLRVKSYYPPNQARSEFIIDKFFLVPSAEFNSSDVTLLSQGDISAVEENLENLCEYWKGPLSIAAYNHGYSYNQIRCYLINLQKCSPCLQKYLSLHLVSFRNYYDESDPVSCSSSCSKTQALPEHLNPPNENFYYPNNILRNVARKTLQTDWQFMVDIDLIPSEHARSSFLELAEKENLDIDAKTAYVLPAFEAKKKSQAPRIRSDLVKRYMNDVQPFHNWCQICYVKSQNYNKWIELDKSNKKPQNDEVSLSYEIQYHKPFEPYYIAGNTKDLPLFREEFRGYGYNKVEQSYEMSVRKWKFITLDSQFVTHQGWKEPTQSSPAKTKQQEHNEKLFKAFNKELHQK